MLSRQFLFTILALFAGVTADVALADAGKKEARTVVLQVRSVQANELINRPVGSHSISLDGMLEDIREKLQQLPYRNFKVLTARNIVVVPKKKTSVNLTDGQRLNVRMHYASKDKIGLWLHWHAVDGEELLNTRIHVNPGTAIIAGAEGPGRDQAKILAIRVIE